MSRATWPSPGVSEGISSEMPKMQLYSEVMPGVSGQYVVRRKNFRGRWPFSCKIISGFGVTSAPITSEMREVDMTFKIGRRIK
jgi:hypothetical protein